MKSLGLAFGALVLLAPNLFAQPQTYHFVTIAGDSSVGTADGTNNDSRFNEPRAVAVDLAGNLFVVDQGNSTIRKLTRVGTNWVSSTIAGLPGHQGSADGTNGNARFRWPFGIAVDEQGTLFVVDAGNLTIRQVKRTGTNWVVSTIAGSPGLQGKADGTNCEARFTSPVGIAVDKGNVFVTDNHVLRKLTPVGTNWVSSTIATSVGSGYLVGLSFDSVGELYLAGSYSIGNDGEYGQLFELEQAGTNWAGTAIAPPPESSRGFFQIAGGPGQTLFLAKQSQTIWQATLAGTNWLWSKVAGQTGITGSADGTNEAALFYYPAGITVDQAGDLYIADSGNNTIRQIKRVGSDWVSSTIAGRAPQNISADGTNNAALFTTPFSIAVDNASNIFTADYDAHAIRQTSQFGTNWVTTTIAGALGNSGNSNGTNNNARFYLPSSLALGPNGEIYVADSGNNTIRQIQRIGTDWITTTIAGSVGNTNRQDGTNVTISFDRPNAIAADSAGNLFVSEYGRIAIRILSRSGTNWVSSTLAGPSIGSIPPFAIAAGTRELFISDGSFNISHLILNGVNWSLADNPSDGASRALWYNAVAGITLDGTGALVLADPGNYMVDKLIHVATNWVLRPLGGFPQSSAMLDGTVMDARFMLPIGIAADKSGNIYVTDGTTLRMGVPALVSAPAPVMCSSQTAASITLSWNTTPGLTYLPEYKSDLNSTNWAILGESIPATNENVSMSDPLVPGTSRFYRVVILP